MLERSSNLLFWRGQECNDEVIALALGKIKGGEEIQTILFRVKERMKLLAPCYEVCVQTRCSVGLDDGCMQ